MTNNLTIKKYWVITLCSLFCSIASFAQKLSDKEIGFNENKVISSLKAHGVKNEELASRVSSMRDLQKSQYLRIQKSRNEFFQRNIIQKTSKTTTTAKSAVVVDISQTERQALIALYNSTTGSNWYKQSGWSNLTNNNIKVTDLYGVTIENGKVIKIQLYDNNLSGPLPSEIGSFPYLQELHLTSNNLTGTLPTQIGQLKNLEILYLTQNNLSGELPAEIGQLTNIKYISCGNNQFTGTLPVEISQLQNLEYFDIYNNSITGNIPPQIGLLSKLKGLDLSSNQLEGTIPTQILSLPNLEGLILSLNKLNGTLTGLNQLKKLVRLDLSSNEFTGTIPSELSQLTNLYELDLLGNHLTGSIPLELCSLAKLVDLNLGANELTGSIPSQIGQLKGLRFLNLGGNSLNGSVPSGLGLLSNLGSIQLGYNNFSGSLPAEMSSLRYVTYIDVSHNKLEGIIPNMANAIELYYFDITYNKFRFVDFAAQFPIYKRFSKFMYNPQDITDEEKTINTFIGNSVTLEMFSDGRFIGDEEYVWCKLVNDGIHYSLPVPGGTSRKLTIPAVSSTDIGTYYCIARHPQMTQYGYDYYRYLNLQTGLIHVKISPCNPIINGVIKTSIAEPLPNEDINFSFETSNTGVTYKWTFYDLDNVTEIATSTSAQVTRSYSSLGKYNVKLVVTDAEGCNETFSKGIIIAPKTCPSIIGTLKTDTPEPALNSPMQFSFETAATGLSYYWTFYDRYGNSVIDVQRTPTATQIYTEDGTYKVNLAVTDETTGCSSSFDKTFVLKPICTPSYSWDRDGEFHTPNSAFGNFTGVLINTPTNFNFLRYGSPLANVEYSWKLYDPNGQLMQSGNEANFPVTITKLENYKITLRISNYNGCSDYEKIITGQDPNDCIIPSKDRYNDSVTIQPSDNRGVQVGTETTLGLGYIYYDYSESDFTFSWKAYDPNNVLISSGNEPRFPVTFPTTEEYRVDLELKDIGGCKTNYTKKIIPLTYCDFTKDDLDGEIYNDISTYDSGLIINRNQTENMYFYPYGSSENFTYKWDVLNSKGVSIASSELEVFPLTLETGGKFQIRLTVKDTVSGCERQITQELQCLIDNSCTNTNPKSQKVKELYEELLISLLARSIQGETDDQINASAPTKEFIALKPYITNGPKDKIYNYVSTSRNYTEVDGREKVFRAQFSFSPNREYDVDAIIGWGIGYDAKKTTIANLKATIKDSLYTDLSQYVSSEQFIKSCKRRYYAPTRVSKKMDSPSFYNCDYSSEIRHINFCPGEVNTCDPAIVGHIRNPEQTIFTDEDASFYFYTDAQNLTYTWTVTTEEGELINTSSPDITVPYVYKFKYEGSYIIKVIAKDETGCTAAFISLISVTDTHCPNSPYGFKFETAEENLNYIWTVTDDNNNIVATETNSSGLFTFIPAAVGHYDVNLTTSGTENCRTLFSKHIFIRGCGGSVSCTENNLLSAKIHDLFIALVNKLLSTPEGANVNEYAKNEIAALIPYASGPEAKIYKFSNTQNYISFSFTENSIQDDIKLIKSVSGAAITSINLSRYNNAQAITNVITAYSDGTTDTNNGYVRNINFCPSEECTPITGVINIVKRGTASTNKKTNSSSKI
jgi:Leucine-rich repeat (LRR) protein